MLFRHLQQADAQGLEMQCHGLQIDVPCLPFVQKTSHLPSDGCQALLEGCRCTVLCSRSGIAGKFAAIHDGAPWPTMSLDPMLSKDNFLPELERFGANMNRVVRSMDIVHPVTSPAASLGKVSATLWRSSLMGNVSADWESSKNPWVGPHSALN